MFSFPVIFEPSGGDFKIKIIFVKLGVSGVVTIHKSFVEE